MRRPEARRITASDAFRELIVEPSLTLDAPTAHRLIIIDSLDEAQYHDGETVLDVLVAQAGDLPNWLRIVATTRPEAPIMERLRVLTAFELRADRAENQEDLRRYIAARIQADELVARIASDADAVGQRISEIADGNFLYAKLLLDALEDGSVPVEGLVQLTPKLAGFYDSDLRRSFPDPDAYLSGYAPIMRVLSASQTPLPFGIIVSAAGVGAEIVYHRLRALRHYLQVEGAGDEATYALFHASLQDWLTDRDTAGDHWIDSDKGVEALAEACWRQYQSGSEAWSDYLLLHGQYHLHRAGRMSQNTEMQADSIFQARRIDRHPGSLFISYSHGDAEAAVAIEHVLGEENKYRLWRDHRIHWVAEFPADYGKALQSAAAVIWLVSRRSLSSAWVNREWAYPWGHGVTLIPVLLDCRPEDLPDELQGLAAIGAGVGPDCALSPDVLARSLLTSLGGDTGPRGLDGATRHDGPGEEHDGAYGMTSPSSVNTAT